MAEIEALAVNAGIDLSHFARYLSQQGIAHRITESAGRQLVLVGTPAHAQRVRELYDGLRDGSVELPRQVVHDIEARRNHTWNWQTVTRPLMQYKVVTCGMLLSLLGFLLVELNAYIGLVHYFTFFDSARQLVGFTNLPPPQSVGAGQFWRMLTPIFLHFSILHLVFNMLWFWEFGRRIEGRLGSVFLLILVCVLGIASNTIQSLFSNGVPFGGMSGVIYGLLGFCWLWDKVNPKAHFNLPPGIVGFMIGWLLLCLSGIISAFGLGDIANAVHVSGLINGVLLGAIFGWFYRSHTLPNGE